MKTAGEMIRKRLRTAAAVILLIPLCFCMSFFGLAVHADEAETVQPGNEEICEETIEESCEEAVEEAAGETYEEAGGEVYEEPAGEACEEISGETETVCEEPESAPEEPAFVPEEPAAAPEEPEPAPEVTAPVPEETETTSEVVSAPAEPDWEVEEPAAEEPVWPETSEPAEIEETAPTEEQAEEKQEIEPEPESETEFSEPADEEGLAEGPEPAAADDETAEQPEEPGLEAAIEPDQEPEDSKTAEEIKPEDPEDLEDSEDSEVPEDSVEEAPETEAETVVSEEPETPAAAAGVSAASDPGVSEGSDGTGEGEGPGETGEPEEPVPDGFIERDGKRYYYENGVPVTGWRRIDGNRYYFDEEDGGAALTGWQHVSDRDRYFGEDGIVKEGFFTVDGENYLASTNGAIQYGLRTVEGSRYYFDEGNGGAAGSGWMRIDGSRYYFDEENGGAALTGWQNVSGHDRYFDSKGAVKEGVFRVGGNTYLASTNGAIRYGLMTYAGKTYHFNAENNGAADYGWQTINDNRYYFNKKEGGAAYTGWHTNSAGHDRCFTEKGVMRTGWYTVQKADVFRTPALAGNTYYFQLKNGLALTGARTIDGQEYRFDENSGVLEGRIKSVKLSSSVPSDVAPHVLNVLDYGAVPGDDEEDTDAFIEAIRNAKAGETVYVPAGEYSIDARTSLTLHSDMNLIMDRDAVLNIVENGREYYEVIDLTNVNNVNIFGGKIKGERYIHTGETGEHGMGIGIFDSTNVCISHMTIQDNWGDGIYIGKNAGGSGCDGVSVRKCNISSNRRSNVTVTDADNLTIDSCTVADAEGVAPQCGINVEPNAVNGHIPEDSICKHIRFLNSVFRTLGPGGDKWGQFFCFMTIHNPNDPTYISADDFQVVNCVMNGDCGNYSAINARIVDSIIRGIFYDRQNTVLENVKYKRIWRP